MTSVTLKLRSRSPSSNLIFVLPWCFCVSNLVKVRQIFLEILSGNHLAYAHLPACSYNAITRYVPFFKRVYKKRLGEFPQFQVSWHFFMLLCAMLGKSPVKYNIRFRFRFNNFGINGNKICYLTRPPVTCRRQSRGSSHMLFLSVKKANLIRQDF